MKTSSLGNIFLLVCGIFTAVFLTAPAVAQESSEVMELRRLVEAQQKQLEVQQRQLASQQKQLEMQEKQFELQKQSLQDLQTQMLIMTQSADTAAPAAAVGNSEARPKAVSTRDQPRSAKTEVATDESQSPEKVVAAGDGARGKLAISGWVNQMVNVVDDGKDTEAYFVDNDNAESRVNLTGTAEVNEDLTLGSVIELTIAPNLAGTVSQVDQENNNVFDQRITEAFLDSKQFGKLSLGKGHTASYGTASRDLSRTNVISYATISDTAGGILFRQDDDDSLTDLNIAEAFKSFDGLSRQNRVRYDTPKYHGFHLSASAISDQRYDAALWWEGQGYGFKAIGGGSVANPNEDDTGLQYAGSFSLLHEDTGLNLTLSSGLLERDNQSDASNLYGKVGWLTRFFPFGETAFSLDYTRTQNQPTENDDGYSVGAAAVQFFEEYGAEVYFLYRLYSLDRDLEPDVQDIGVVSIGTRVKF